MENRKSRKVKKLSIEHIKLIALSDLHYEYMQRIREFTLPFVFHEVHSEIH